MIHQTHNRRDNQISVNRSDTMPWKGGIEFLHDCISAI